MFNKLVMLLAATALMPAVDVCAAEIGPVPRYHVIDIPVRGKPIENGADLRDHMLWAAFTLKETGETIHQHGFWDGGDRFVVRFCPPKVGEWRISELSYAGENVLEQHRDTVITCSESKHPGYWIVDGRWFRRSDGSHPYITGNTHYSFLSRRGSEGAVIAGSAADDIRANAAFFKKVRFSLFGDRYADPQLKPFLDELGRGTDSGRFSHRPNPQWFRERVDPAVRAGFDADVICDLILAGPDTADSRATLSNPGPWLSYVAARYGSFPNVWLCMANEWDIKQPRYEPEVFWNFGDAIGRMMQPRGPLVPRIPVSVHSNAGPWPQELNSGHWNTHVIIQQKCRTLTQAADAAVRAIKDGGGKPVVNDENAYQGVGDKYTEADTVAGCVGTLLGGGYPSTGEKHGKKDGQYFWGGFDPAVHTAAPKLGFLRRFVDEHVAFWRMSPGSLDELIAGDPPRGVRLLREPGEQYLLGTEVAASLKLKLPPGEWKITQADVLAMTQRVIADKAAGEITLETSDSRALLTYLRRVP